MVRTPVEIAARVPVPGAVKELTVGLAVPPVLFSTRPARVLLPNKLTADPPLRVTTFAALIWPTKLFIVTVPLLIVNPPAGITATAEAAFRASVPPLRTVPPV